MALPDRCLELLPPGARFRTAAQIAQHTGTTQEEALAALFAMYKDHRLDRLLLIAGDSLTGYYGRHRTAGTSKARGNTTTTKGTR